MYAQIKGNLVRQVKGLELLEELLEEEHGYLLERDTDSIIKIEFSIHQLLRQLAVERDDMKKVMQGTRLKEYAGMLAEEESACLQDLIVSVDRMEQVCAKKAEKNTSLSLLLLDKSHEMMNFLYEQVQPKERLVYGSKGSLSVNRPPASLISALS